MIKNKLVIQLFFILTQVIGFLSASEISVDQWEKLYDLGKENISAILKSPASARFPDSDNILCAYRKDGLYQITAYVDAQNGFGALLREDWLCIFDIIEDRMIVVCFSFNDKEYGTDPSTYLASRRNLVQKIHIQNLQIKDRILHQQEVAARIQKHEEMKKSQSKIDPAYEKEKAIERAENFKKYSQLKTGETFQNINILGKDFKNVKIVKNENRMLTIKHDSGVDFLSY